MAQVTIQTSKQHRFNRSFIIDGRTIKFDEFGMAEIPERYLQGVLMDRSISLVDKPDIERFEETIEEAKKKRQQAGIPAGDLVQENRKLKTDNKLLKESNDALYQKVETLTNQLNQASKSTKAPETKKKSKGKKTQKKQEPKKQEVVKEEDNSVDEMSPEELKTLCTELEFKKEDWEHLNDDDLKAFVKKQIDPEPFA